MSNIRDTDLLLVNRSGFSYQCQKQDIGSNVRNSDLFLVNRSGFSFQCAKSDVQAKVRDTDAVLVNRSGFSYQATGADFKAAFSKKPNNFGLGTSWGGAMFVDRIRQWSNHCCR